MGIRANCKLHPSHNFNFTFPHCGGTNKVLILFIQKSPMSSKTTLTVRLASLCVAVARLLCPRAAELPDHPGEGGGGAREGSRAKIQQLPAEASAGPGTTRPLTPGAPPLSTCCAAKRVGARPQSPSDWLIYSETGAGAEPVFTPPLHCTHTRTRGASAHGCRSQLRTQHLPLQAPAERRVRVICEALNEDTHSGKNKLQQDPNLEILCA